MNNMRHPRAAEEASNPPPPAKELVGGKTSFCPPPRNLKRAPKEKLCKNLRNSITPPQSLRGAPSRA